MKTLKYLIYIGYNFLYLKIACFLLLYFETYVNGSLIPDKFIWNKDGTRRNHPVIWGTLEDLALLILESALLLLLLYYINKLFLRKVVKSTGNIVARWTIFALAILVIGFLTSLRFGNSGIADFFFSLSLW